MTETTSLRQLLLPELEAELAKTRRILEALPEGITPGQLAFKPHEKSKSLAQLAGHTAELPSFIKIILTSPDLDMASPSSPRQTLVVESKPQLLAQFNENADGAITALKQTSDQILDQHWKLSRGPLTIFSGTRYAAYRGFGVNHLIHHRAQLGCYLRELNLPLPGTYGPSADGM